MVQLTLKLAIIVALAISPSNSRKIRKRSGRVAGDDKVTGENHTYLPYNKPNLIRLKSIVIAKISLSILSSVCPTK